MVDKGEERKEKHKKLFIYCLNILYLYAKHPKKKIGQSSSNCGEEQTLLNLVAPVVLHYLCAKTKKRPEKESNRLVCTNNFLDPSRCNLYGVYISPTLPIFCQFYCLTQEGEKKRRRRDSSSKKRALAKGGEEVH